MEYMFDSDDCWKYVILLEARTEALDIFKCMNGSCHGNVEIR